MKSNLLLHASFALFSSLMVAGCSQNEILNESVDTANVLKVNVTENVFESVDSESRAVDNGAATTFENGDKIGVYIVKEGGEIVKKNVTLTYNGSAWDGTLYYYEGADYIAYYPYDEAMGEMTSVDDIKDYFSENKYSVEQNSAETYRNCDLMTAEVKAKDVVEGGNLDLALSHAMALVEFNIPTYAYKTSEDADAYTYGVPLSDLTITLGETVYTPYNISTGVYRCIVSPSDAAFDISGSFTDAKEDKPVKFAKTGVTMAANQYKRYNVTYDGKEGTGVTTRHIEVGDYYYADGNIVPKDFTKIPEGCIGVVFSTSTNGELALDGETACNHGYVLSLKNASGGGVGAGAWEYSLWTTTPADWTTVGLTPTAYESVDWSTLQNDNNGLAYTNAIVSNIEADGVDKLKHALDTYGEPGMAMEAYAASDKTTGWFVPSVGQLISIVHNLGGDSDFAGTQVTNESFKKINEVLEKAGGEIESKKDDEFESNAGTKWWSSNVGTAKSGSTTGAFLLELNNSGKCEIWVAGYNSKYRVRPILAF
ncbi:fimbrillin family protein [Phocaeicola plebeius]|uniref:fimbrillin family protein n=1 Tax=Phocaeicola plebeius TaxID=310297 RepID=UPI0026EE56C6|nr:fimbrillin family protein [Phocaeicola plebeius]